MSLLHHWQFILKCFIYHIYVYEQAELVTKIKNFEMYVDLFMYLTYNSSHIVKEHMFAGM